MAQSLEYYLAETSKNYEPARQALQNQINAVDERLGTATENINNTYKLQQGNLNRNRNDAMYNASLQAAGSGGSFGGATQLANDRYYRNMYVPAQTSLMTNQSNDLANARQSADDSRLSLQSQLANLESEMANYATQRYDNAVEQERQAALQRAQIAAQNRYYDYLAQAMNGGGSGNNSPYYTQNGSDFNYYYADGRPIRMATYAQYQGGDWGNAFRNQIYQMANAGDRYANTIKALMNSGKVFKYNDGDNFHATGNDVYDTFGIVPTDYTWNGRAWVSNGGGGGTVRTNSSVTRGSMQKARR